MERLEHYRQCIRKLLSEQAMPQESNPDIECELIFDALASVVIERWTWRECSN